MFSNHDSLKIQMDIKTSAELIYATFYTYILKLRADTSFWIIWLYNALELTHD